MKTRSFLLPLFGLAALLTAGCSTPPASPSAPTEIYTSPAGSAAATEAANITVTFNDPEKFTDARSSYSGNTDRGYLDSLTQHLKRMAKQYVKADEKLEVTFSDVDLAGDFRPGSVQMTDVRLIKEIYRPRMTLTFKLVGADGKVIKEGARTLIDSYFMNNVNLINRDDPLYYDKEMLTTWVRDEFKN